MPMPSCFRLLMHCARRAASRADCTAGSKSAISTPMMAMTTNSSIRVKPRLRRVSIRTPPSGMPPGFDRPSGSELIGRDDLAPVLGADRPPGTDADRVLDEPATAVGEQDVDPAGVPAP